MGNCLKRNQKTNKSSQDYFMGFRVVPVERNSEISKLLSRCKKRKQFRKGDHTSKKSFKGINDKITNIFEYEEPVDLLDDKEVCGFLKVDKGESEEAKSLLVE